MTHTELQRRLARDGFYTGKIDGIFGVLSKAALMQCLRSGPDYLITSSEIVEAAQRLGVDEATIWAVYEVESSGNAFIDGLPTILFEPHRFSRSTDHQYDDTHPHISSRTWNRQLYPGSQAGRWKQLMDAVALDVDAGFMSASYGAFQILGENYAICDAPDPFSFAWRQSQTEGDQLDAFIRFIDARNLLPTLKRRDWAAFAKGYNGTAYKQNRYDTKLAEAYLRYSHG